MVREHVKSLPHGEAMNFVDDLCDELAVAEHPDNSIMTWAEIKKLAAEGVVLGAHTHTHPLVNRISLDEAEREATQSLKELEQRVGDVLPIFAYPSGGANETVAARLGNAGFRVAFTTERGINDLRSENPLLLKRINVGGNTSLNIMRGQLHSAMRLIN